MKSKLIPRWLVFGTQKKPKKRFKRGGVSLTIHKKPINRGMVFDFLMCRGEFSAKLRKHIRKMRRLQKGKG